MREHITELSYLVAAVLFILGLRSLTRPDKARQGMQLAAIGMLLAVCGTLIHHEIVDYRWLAAVLVGVSEYYNALHGTAGVVLDAPHMAALGFEVLLGSLTVTGALIAFG